MTILSIVVCDITSKIYFARQFQEMSRKQLEEYVVMFSRTVSQEKELTSLETEKNRFLYFYSDPLYLVLITSLDSNIIEDIEVLKLANRLIFDICGVVKLTEESIIDNAFEIALGLDDLITFGSFEGLNLVQVKNLLQMDSAEEKEFRKVQMQKEKHTKEQLDIFMREQEKKRRNNALFSDAVGSEKYDTIQLGSLGGVESEKEKEESSNFSSSKKEEEEDSTTTTKTGGKKVTKSKGLSLGKKKKEIHHVEIETTQNTNSNSKIAEKNEIKDEEEEPETKFNPLNDPIKLEIEEKIKGEINKDGEFKRLEIKGEGFITLLNPLKSKGFIVMKSSTKTKFTTSKINKNLFNEKGVIQSDVSFNTNLFLYT